jgi:hypothetical protein
LLYSKLIVAYLILKKLTKWIVKSIDVLNSFIILTMPESKDIKNASKDTEESYLKKGVYKFSNNKSEMQTELIKKKL